jgi:hypothetical protein
VVAKTKASITAPFLADELKGSNVAPPDAVVPIEKAKRIAKITRERKLTKAEQVLADTIKRQDATDAAAALAPKKKAGRPKKKE